MANNTAGLWQSHREGRGKIMVAQGKRRSVSSEPVGTERNCLSCLIPMTGKNGIFFFKLFVKTR